MSERKFGRPGVEFQRDLREFLGDPQPNDIFQWQSQNVFSEPIDMDLVVRKVDKGQETLKLAGTIRLNGHSSSFTLLSSREVSQEIVVEREPYVGDESYLIRWLDTIAWELSMGMHRHVITDVTATLLTVLDRECDPEKLYEQLLEKLSRNRSRSMLEN